MKRNMSHNKAKGRCKLASSNDFVSFKLHGIKLTDVANLSKIESISKAYNSAKRCALKKFQSIGLNGLMKNQVPIERNPLANFKDFDIVDGKPCYYMEPNGMSREMWYEMRKNSYLTKRLSGLRRASKLWQLDKDLGSPISGTEKIVGEWLKSHEFNLDSTMLHNAILDGLKSYKAFEKKASKYQTKKKSPSFGELEERSKNNITKEEFQFSRNGSFTIVGQGSKGGNPKFKFNIENDNKMFFVVQRKKIEFNLDGHRFSKRGYQRFCNLVELMNDGKLPVTITLSREGCNSFSVSLTYSQSKYSTLMNENSTHKNHIVSSIYGTDEVVCHQVVDVKKNKVLHFKKYDIVELIGEKENRREVESIKWKNGKSSDIAKLNKRLRNKTLAETSKLIEKLFKINKSYGVGLVVMEKPRSRNLRNFNHSLLEFDKSKIMLGDAKQCFMSSSKLMKMVKNQCIKNGMNFNSVNGAFLQLESLLCSNNDMNEALANACSILVKRNFAGFDIRAIDWGKMMSHHPSMLDWVGHLLRKKQSRRARCEIRNAFEEGAVEKAVRLCDNRRKCCLEDEGRHSHECASIK